MSKRGARRRRGSGKSTPRDHNKPTPRTEVHVELALGGMDLRQASGLVKPALLYADRVTVYSPAASMVQSVQQLAEMSDPREQLLTMLDLAAEVPALRAEISSLDPVMVEALKQFLAVDPAVVRLLGQTDGAGDQIDEMYSHLDKVSATWQEQMPDALTRSVDSVGGRDLLLAVESGVVTVSDLSAPGGNSFVASALRAASGSGDQNDDFSDRVLADWVGSVFEMLHDPSGFPLLDPTTADLMRAFDREIGIEADARTLKRGAEISAAADFMEFLPYFPDMPMDEVLDLRSKLQTPLVRFRGEMAGLSRDFTTRQFDADFSREVEDAWRERVAPSLEDIREALADHGLLREVGRVVRGSVSRTVATGGGALIVAGSGITRLSDVMAFYLAAVVPAADVIGRALNEQRRNTRNARESSFYFLHTLSEEARRQAESS